MPATRATFLHICRHARGAHSRGACWRRLLKKPVEKELAIIGAVVLAVSMFLLPLCHSLGALMLVCAGVALGKRFRHSYAQRPRASRSADRRAVQGRALGFGCSRPAASGGSGRPTAFHMAAGIRSRALCAHSILGKRRDSCADGGIDFRDFPGQDPGARCGRHSRNLTTLFYHAART